MPKVGLDIHILKGLMSISVNEPDYNPNLDNPEKTNPKYIRISFFSDDDHELANLAATKTVSNPTVYRVKNICGSQKNMDFESMNIVLINVIKEQVRKYGTIQEIRITGHGDTGYMSSRDDGNSEHYFFINPFLQGLARLEKKFQIKIADRIVFDGCNTFSLLDDDTIKRYSEYAKEYRVQLVGATSEVGTAGRAGGILPVIHYGRYIQFTTNGTIVRDHLDTRFNPLVLMRENDRSWTDFYLGQTPEEGIAARKKYENRQKTELERELSRQQYGPKF